MISKANYEQKTFDCETRYYNNSSNNNNSYNNVTVIISGSELFYH
jgi:hypothetical protein